MEIKVSELQQLLDHAHHVGYLASENEAELRKATRERTEAPAGSMSSAAVENYLFTTDRRLAPPHSVVIRRESLAKLAGDLIAASKAGELTVPIFDRFDVQTAV